MMNERSPLLLMTKTSPSSTQSLSSHQETSNEVMECHGFSSVLSPIPERRELRDDECLIIPEGHAQQQEEDEETNENANVSHHSPQLFYRTRTRTLSLECIVLDTLDAISDVKEVVVEGITEVLEEELLPVRPREVGDHRQKLTALSLAIIVFYKVSGGPFGCEPTIRAAGPFYSLLGFMIFPLLWSLPEALVTAELGSAFPEPSGSVAWIEEAFGPRAGLLCGYFHWVSGATDNAIYPSLFLEYVSSFLRGATTNTEAFHDTTNDSVLEDPNIRFIFSCAITAMLAFITFTGLEIVGKVSIVVAIISMSPFLLLIIFGLPKVDPSRWFLLPSQGGHYTDDDAITFFPAVTFAGIMWRPFVNNLFWNLNSFDVGASFAGEVENPDQVFPRAMKMSLVFVILSYLLPLLVALGVSDSPQESWKAGHLTVIAQETGGVWLASWTVLAAAVSCIALFLAEMSGDAWQLLGMADRGLIPKIFCRRSRFDTPTNGILLGTFIIFFLSFTNFDALVEMLNFSFCVALFMEYAAFIKLRISKPNLRRPYRVPLNVAGCLLFVLPSCFICIFVMMVASKTTYIYVLVMVLFGIIFHFVQKAAKHYDWWEYATAKRVTTIE